jgi:hypothetical protein
MAYNALNDLEKAAVEGVPIGQALGDNRATAARRLFVEGFGRAQSGGVISSDDSLKALSGIFSGGEIQNFEAMLPKPGDTPRVAKEKIDNMREAIEIQVIAQGIGTAQDWQDFVGRASRAAQPLKEVPKLPTGSEETSKQVEGVLGAVEGIAAGVGDFLRGKAVKNLQEPMTAAELESFETGETPPPRIPVPRLPDQSKSLLDLIQDQFKRDRARERDRNEPPGKQVIRKPGSR